MGRRKIISDEKMLEGARNCFLEFGPHVSTEVIAERLGVSQATLFKRYGAKEDLMIAALAPPSRPDWFDVLERGPDERSLRKQLFEIANLLNTHVENVFPRISVLRAAGLDPEKIFVKTKAAPPIGTIKQLAAWFRRAHKNGLIRKVHANAAAIAFMGAVHSRLFLSLHSPDAKPLLSAKAHIDNLVDTFIHGIERGGKA